MITKIVPLLLMIWPLVLLTDSANPNCCNGKGGGEVTDLVNDCSNCGTECECSLEDCDFCHSSDKCCRTCCEQRCNCLTLNCNQCSAQYSQCCTNCCNNKCRNTGCSTAKYCNQCTCNTCGGKQMQQISCCNSCCNKQRENTEESRNTITQKTTLPNITIIINHAPIYVNNTPIIRSENRCGNASMLTNGTHIVYVYPHNSTCSNRTCCTREMRRACRPMPIPLPPMCPPPVYVPDCSPRCLHLATVSLPPTLPCEYFQSWPYVHCPQTGCYGYTCSPPMMAPPSPPPMVVQGCIPVPAWPFVRCIPGAGSDSIVSYGPPSYQVMVPGGGSPAVPFSSTDHNDAP